MTKVADLQIAVGIDAHVGRLQVAVYHVGRVNVLEATQQLVHEKLDVVASEGLGRPDDSMEVRVEEVGDDEDVLENCGIWCDNYLLRIGPPKAAMLR